MLGASLRTEKTNLDKIDTLISKNVKIEGKISTTGTVRFDCEIIGDIFAEGVIIGETGEIKGNIECDDIIISGIVEGSVLCKNKMHIKETGSQIGDIEVGLVIIDEGAKFEGSCQMKNNYQPNKTKTTISTSSYFNKESNTQDEVATTSSFTLNTETEEN